MNKKITAYFNKYSLFMSFPVLLILGQNISLVYFGIMFLTSKKKTLFLQTTHWIQNIVLLFCMGALISVVDSNVLDGGVTRGMAVLFNYFYWSITVIFLVNMRNFLNYNIIVKYISFGLILSIVYYYISPFIFEIPGFINNFSPNGFAFLCICFTAPAATYLLHKKGLVFALLFIVVVLVTLLLAGRRAGFLLVFISSVLSISIKSLNIKYLAIGTTLSFILFLTLQFDFVDQIILSSSQRVHELIYDNENIATEDRSLLTRKLMVEKSVKIFSEHPLTGIGLNNFSKFDVNFSGNFEGAQHVINKSEMNETSAHNSYASLLGEGGLLLLVPFIMLLLFNFYKFINNFKSRSQIQNAFYWSFLCSCIHMYFISALLNVNAWFLIGIVTAMSAKSYKRILKSYS